MLHGSSLKGPLATTTVLPDGYSPGNLAMAVGTYRAGCSHCSNVLWEYMQASWTGTMMGSGKKRDVVRIARVSRHLWARELRVRAGAQQ